MGVVTQQYVSPESDRAEAQRGCSKCGEKGHYARTCNKKAPEPEKPRATGFAYPLEGWTRRGSVSTIVPVRIESATEWDVYTSVNYEASRPIDRHKWQIWQDAAGGVHVWHDGRKSVVHIGPSNVAYVTDFTG